MKSPTWDARRYADHAAFVAELGLPLLQLLRPRPGEEILDIGCGDGALTEKIAATGAAVLGIDASASMVKAARRRGLQAQVLSGERLPFEGRFDAVFSNAALHWMPDADAVISGVSRALKPGGRFVAELGGRGNVATLVDAMEAVFARHPEFGGFVNPWFFPAADDYARRLQRGGFAVQQMVSVPRPTPLTSGVKEWLRLFAEGITGQLSPAQRETFLEETEDLLRPKIFTSDRGWVADYVRLRFVAAKA
ncbi:MAG: class I SAM-dependent methyltransferase [Gammaproteobacteria bacterium]